MAAVDELKLYLGIDSEDTDRDELLELIVTGAESRILSLLNAGTEEVPEELQYIVTELSVIRFNRIGNEGMATFTQDGESITYSDDDLAAFMDAIDAWNAAQIPAQKGRVRFL